MVDLQLDDDTIRKSCVLSVFVCAVLHKAHANSRTTRALSCFSLSHAGRTSMCALYSAEASSYKQEVMAILKYVIVAGVRLTKCVCVCTFMFCALLSQRPSALSGGKESARPETGRGTAINTVQLLTFMRITLCNRKRRIHNTSRRPNLKLKTRKHCKRRYASSRKSHNSSAIATNSSTRSKFCFLCV